MPPRRSSEEQDAERAVAKAAAAKIQRFAEENVEQIIEKLWALSDAKKTVWVTCSNSRCRKRQEVEIPDTVAAMRTLELLMTRGFGRPRQEVGEEGGLTVVRTVVPPKGANGDSG